jgi:hypothetical protein
MQWTACLFFVKQGGFELEALSWWGTARRLQLRRLQTSVLQSGEHWTTDADRHRVRWEALVDT